MAQVTSGLRSILSLPEVYSALQRLFGADANRRNTVNRFIRPKPGDRILDIGCGTSEILSHMPDVRYVGYDPNPKYIEYGRKRFAGRGEFFAGLFDAEKLARHEPFDIAILMGVLHHLGDSEAAHLLGLLRKATSPGGRLVTLDNVFIENQNPIARKLIEWDRGKNVRTAEQYRALVAAHFGNMRETIVHVKMPPYTLFIMECS